MNGRASRRKGFNAEREVVKLAQRHDLTATRAYGSNGASLGQAATCDITIQDTPWQVKRRKAIAHYVKPPAGTIGTLIREDHGSWLAVLPAETLFRLIELTGIELETVWKEDA
jgi:hypothetical protein